MDAAVRFGIDTFGDVTRRPDGGATPMPEVIRQVVDEAVLADAVGIDAFGLGEHHRPDFAVSAPDVVLAAAASRTERITLGSAVTVLSSDDPVRVFQRFATLDALSGGRAEVTLGRGSFTESFPLFGHDLGQYETLFEEKLDILVRLLAEAPITWSGTVRPPLAEQRVYPTTASGRLSTWIGVGGSPQSVLRAAVHRLPMMLAIIGGDPRRFAPYADLYRRAFAELGGAVPPIGVHSPGLVAETDEAAREAMFADYSAMRDRIGRERGWPPSTRREYDDEVSQGSLYVGSPETVARKIAATVSALGVQRFDLKYSAGALPHADLLRTIELYGTRVVPRVRQLLAEERVPAAR